MDRYFTLINGIYQLITIIWQIQAKKASLLPVLESFDIRI